MTPTPDTNLVNARGRKYCTLEERNRFLAAIRAHADLATTALYTTAIGAEARELVSRVWT